MNGRGGAPRALIILAALAIATQSGAFVRDTHYDVTFATALTTCFDWDEAHLIASADFMIDQNKTTKAESNPLKKKSKVVWHAFSHSGERYLELWDRVLVEKDPDLQLVKFGQFLHFLQDWESHAGFGSKLGHAAATITGHDPDSMALSELRTYSAIRSTLEHMGKLCAHRGSLADEYHNTDVALIDYFEDFFEAKIIKDLIDTSNPRWRRGKTGGLNRLGKRILALNQERVEVFIEDHLKSNPENKVPDDFEAAREGAFPPALSLIYDPEGNLLNELDVARAEARGEGVSSVEDGDSLVRVLDVQPVKKGWRVRVEVENIGGSAVAEGTLTFVASDLENSEELGSLKKPLPALDPGGVTKIDAKLPASRACEDFMISVVLDGADLSALNNFAWYTTGDELEELEDEYLVETEAAWEVRDQTAVDIGFVEAPNVWVTRFGWLCSTVVVRADHKDPTHVLDRLEIDFVDEDGSAILIPSYFDRFWSITPKGRFVPPAAKCYECLRPLDFCPAIPDMEDLPALRFFVEAGAGENEFVVPLDGELGDDVRRSCEAASDEQYVQSGGPVGEDPVGLRVLTFNVWHGLRSGESKTKFPGEDEERKERRFAWQMRLIQELDPDILLFQEVNPNQREARTYAEALGYDEIHVQIQKYRKKLSKDGWPIPVILGGDFNTEPDTASIAAIVDSGLQNVAGGPDFLTWDPVKNHENQGIGSKRGWPLPTYDLEEVETLLASRKTTARQIDFLFVSEQGEVVSSKMAMDQDRHGMFPSDHFAIFAVIDLELDPPELDLEEAID